MYRLSACLAHFCQKRVVDNNLLNHLLNLKNRKFWRT